MMNHKIRVLVVDDSALMRKKLSDMINSDESCEVIATARNGEEAVRSVACLSPDVVTLDVELPKMDGINALKYIMSEWPTPVIMVTAFTQFGGLKTIQCLEYGAVDLVAKPGGVISLDINKVKEELLEKIKIACRVRKEDLKPLIITRRIREKKQIVQQAEKLIVVASSTGGPRALEKLILGLDAGLAAGLLVIQHMPGGFTQAMAERLDGLSKIPVREAGGGVVVKKGEILIAPGDFQMMIEPAENSAAKIKLQARHRDDNICPSADITMKSIAPLYGTKCMGVILTGMGADGVEGLKAIKQFGGVAIAEDKTTSVVYGMPRAAFESGVVDKVLPLDKIAQEMVRWSQEKHSSLSPKRDEGNDRERRVA